MYTPADRYPDVIQVKTDNISKAFTHHETPAAGVLVPFLQAGTTGLLCGLLAFAVSLYFEWNKPWFIFMVVWFTVMLVAWLVMLKNWRGLFWVLEDALHIDLTGDSIEGEPQKVVSRIEVLSEDKKTLQFADLTLSPEKLTRTAKLIQSGASFSEGGLSSILSRSEFKELRDTFLNRRWLEWRDPDHVSQGLRMSKTGAAVFRHFASQEQPPY